MNQATYWGTRRARRLAEFDQTHITAVCFVYDHKRQVESRQYWWSCFHGYVPERTDDGTVHRVEPKIQYPDENYPFESVATFAWPLASIKNTLDLKKFIEPLLRMINE